MPTDAANPPDPDDAIHLAQLIKHRPAHPDGLIVLLDTCYSGTAPGMRWNTGSGRWKAGCGSRCSPPPTTMPTANAWFTRSLIRLLERGDPAAPDQLRCEDARKLGHEGLTRSSLRSSPPTTPAGTSDSAATAARSPATCSGRTAPAAPRSSSRRSITSRRPDWPSWSRRARPTGVVIVTGEAGVGKSTLAAALARPEITDGRVPPGFAHAVAMLGGTTNLRNLAVDLERQLRHSVAGFAGAVEEFHRSVPRAEREKLDFLGQMVLRPLDYLDGPPVVRVVLDGLDQLPDGTRRQLRTSSSASPDHLRLVMTARDDTPDCPDGTRHPRPPDRPRGPGPLPGGARDTGGGPRGDPRPGAGPLADRAASWPMPSWNSRGSTCPASRGRSTKPTRCAWTRRAPRTTGGRGSARCSGRWPSPGPARSCRWPCSSTRARRWGDLRMNRECSRSSSPSAAWSARRDPGTPDEHAGLFHATLAEYLLSPEAASAGFAIDAEGAHRALAGAIDALAPASDHKRERLSAPLRLPPRGRPLVGPGRVRPGPRVFVDENPTPRERTSTAGCRGMPESWTAGPRPPRHAHRPQQHRGLDRRDGRRPGGAAAVPGAAAGPGAGAGPRPPRHPHHPQQHRALDRRDGRRPGGAAAVPGAAAGPGAGAGPRPPRHPQHPRQHRALDRRDGRRPGGAAAVPGAAAGPGACAGPRPPRHPHHPQTSRSGPARRATAREALRLFRELLPDQERVLGRDHPAPSPPATTSRTGPARWATPGRRCGCPRSCCRTGSGCWAATTPTPSRPATTSRPGPARRATAGRRCGCSRELLPDQERVLGRDHPDTLTTRNNIAHWTGETGDGDGRRCGCSRSCCRTWSGCWAATTPIPSPPWWHGILDHSEWRPGEGCRHLREGLARAETRFGTDHPVTRRFLAAIQKFGCGDPEADAPVSARASLIARPTAILPR